MHLELTDKESAELTNKLHDIIEGDRYPFSPCRRRDTTNHHAKVGMGDDAVEG
jgi:hypothetical protein